MATKTIRTRLPELEPRPRRQKQAVEPIRDLKTVRRIRKMLLERGKVRDALLFCVGCNNGLRISDLLNLKVGQVRDAKVNEKIRITEIKTGKANFLVMNKTCHRILQAYLQGRKFRDSDYLFYSQKQNKDGKKVLDPRSVNSMIKVWCREAGVTGHFGTHSMRKSFGYLQYQVYKTDINVLAERFKHSSSSITRRYIGIDEDSVRDCLLNEI